MATFVPPFPIDPQRRAAATVAISVPATGAAATVTITDPGSASAAQQYITIHEIVAIYSGAGSGAMTIALNSVNQASVTVTGGTGAVSQLAQNAMYFPVGNGNVVITLPGSGSTQGVLIVSYDQV